MNTIRTLKVSFLLLTFDVRSPVVLTLTTRTENLLRYKQSNIFQSSGFWFTFSHSRLQTISMYTIFCLSKLFVVYTFQTLGNNFILTLSEWAFLGLLKDGGIKKVPTPRICKIYSTMMKLGTVIPSLKMILKTCKSCETPLGK